MKNIWLIILGVLLALFEISGRAHIFGMGITLSFLAIIGIPLLLIGFEKQAMTILLAGAVILDIFSPYRIGMYLLSYVLVIMLVRAILARSFEISNPLITSALLVIIFGLLHLLELLADPVLLAFILQVVVNTVLASIAMYLILRFMPTNRNRIKVSEDVRFR